jgi:hypothetical protein
MIMCLHRKVPSPLASNGVNIHIRHTELRDVLWDLRLAVALVLEKIWHEVYFI